MSQVRSGVEPLRNPITGSRCAHATSGKIAAASPEGETASSCARLGSGVVRSPKTTTLQSIIGPTPELDRCVQRSRFRSGCLPGLVELPRHKRHLLLTQTA